MGMDGRKLGFPSAAMRLFLLAYAALMTVGLPFVLSYFRYRGARDRMYFENVGERLGHVARPVKGAYWIHASSLGEVRSATPLIDGLLAGSRKVVVTVLTPAGRREVMRLYPRELEAGDMAVAYAPLEHHWAYRRFFQAHAPVCGVVMEVDLWPRMIASSKRCGVPLFMCNAQYPKRSFERDVRLLPIRCELARGFSGVMAKSPEHAARFVSVGVPDVRVTGELRFDMPLPPGQVETGKGAREWMGAAKRKVIALVSMTEGEEDLVLSVVGKLRGDGGGGEPPLVVVVPRAPERFGAVAGALEGQGGAVARRSRLFGDDLVPVGERREVDVLVGDSTGEMHFYLAMCDVVVVGGGFTKKGSHNIIEPLAQRKAVIVGPETWTIDYPLEEALAAGVVTKACDGGSLLEEIRARLGEKADRDAVDSFVDERSGVAGRTIEALDAMLGDAGAPD